jgi:hypothetical protein
VVRIDVVDADRLVAHPRFARFRRREFDRFELHLFDTALLSDAYRVDLHAVFRCDACVSEKRATIIKFKGGAQAGRIARRRTARRVACVGWTGWFTCLLAFGDAPATTAAAPWTALTESDGVAVYTRAYDGSVFPEVRARGTVCATLPQIVAFVQDVAAFERWIPDTAQARLLERPTQRSQIYYIRTSMPWPVKDRDMIYRLSEPTDSSRTPAIAVDIEGLPDYLPSDPHAVRMIGVTGRWTFVETGGRTRIDLDMHIEPGRGVPAWLARQRIVGTPPKMLSNLKHHFEAGCDVP